MGLEPTPPRVLPGSNFSQQVSDVKKINYSHGINIMKHLREACINHMDSRPVLHINKVLHDSQSTTNIVANKSKMPKNRAIKPFSYIKDLKIFHTQYDYSLWT